MIRALLLSTFALFLSACGEPGYTPDYEFNFTQSCEASHPPAGMCSCTWDKIEANVPRKEFDRYERLSPEQRAGDPLTAQLQNYALSCAIPPAREGTATP